MLLYRFNRRSKKNDTKDERTGLVTKFLIYKTMTQGREQSRVDQNTCDVIGSVLLQFFQDLSGSEERLERLFLRDNLRNNYSGPLSDTDDPMVKLNYSDLHHHWGQRH